MKAKRDLVFVCLFVGVLLIGLMVLPGCDTAEPTREPVKAVTIAEPSAEITRLAEQTTCPVMGGAIDKNIFIEYEGKKVYFCCPGCEEQFKKEPEKYIAKLPQFKN